MTQSAPPGRPIELLQLGVFYESVTLGDFKWRFSSMRKWLREAEVACPAKWRGDLRLRIVQKDGGFVMRIELG